MTVISAMQYPHWMMVAAVLVVLGFIGFAFRQNRDGVKAVDEPTEMKADSERRDQKALLDGTDDRGPFGRMGR
jgi:hypothetical protein